LWEIDVNTISVETLPSTPLDRQHLELVERKGLGHPDTICDLLAEAISRDLCRVYLQTSGRVLHHNIENAFLVAGSSTPALGGGRMNAPMRFVFGDSATVEFNGQPIPVGEIAEAAVTRWFREYLPLVRPERDLVFQNELHPGSIQITDLFAREELGANDTCVGSGYAPLTETEELVLSAERFLNSAEFKRRFPETGQDIKVTGLRRDRKLTLILSLAFIDSRIPDEQTYFQRKEQIGLELKHFLKERMRRIEELEISINTLDQPGRGVAGIYLTVLGTSADGADGGQVGRGNRPNGVNSFMRPLSTSAVAGKNPASNVGKIYNLFAYELARRIQIAIDGLEEVYISLFAQIGASLDRPVVTAVRVVPGAGTLVRSVEQDIAEIVRENLSEIPAFAKRLAHDGLPVC
jgi:S-adenosylmethionine synthetase